MAVPRRILLHLGGCDLRASRRAGLVLGRHYFLPPLGELRRECIVVSDRQGVRGGRVIGVTSVLQNLVDYLLLISFKRSESELNL